MSDVFLHLFGAGVGRDTPPLAYQIPGRMRQLKTELHRRRPRRDLLYSAEADPSNIRPNLQEAENRFLDGLSRLANDANTGTVDSLARRYHLTAKIIETRNLKASLAAFLLIEEANRLTQPRYEAFLATALEQGKPPQFAAKLRVATWNYDSQPGRAYWTFCESLSHVTRQVSRRVLHLNGAAAHHEDSLSHRASNPVG